MNIYELEKRASPAPWNPAPMVKAFDGTPTSGRVLGSLYSNAYDKQGEADAILTAHCRNNFMRTLGALKRAIDACNSERLEKELRKELAELEEIR